MYRQTYLNVDCEKLKNNIIEIKKNYTDYKYFIGVVKANAYGHGSFIINDLIAGGINYLAVSSLEEAIKLREFNTEIPILVLEPISLEFIEVCIQNNVTITVSSLEYFKELLKLNLTNTIKIHIKIDSGMSRLGLQTATELNSIITTLNTQSSNKIFLEGIYTHFATNGFLDKHWDNQVNKFKVITKDIDLTKIPIVHMGRSFTLVSHKKIEFCNGIRIGIIMYGINLNLPKGRGINGFLRNFKNNYIIKKNNISPTTTTNNLKLDTATALNSEVMELRTINGNDFVSYGALFTATTTTKIATIPIGYADGIPKTLKHVEINNKIYNIVGEICMDMLMVLVDDTVKIHDKVTFFGSELLPAKKVAREAGISAYALFTNITTRVPRIYLKDGKTTEIKY